MPLVGGHEGAGVVERVGAHVTHVEVGDHVVLSFSYCGKCASCRSGVPAYCFNIRELNFGGARSDGTRALSLPDGGEVSSHFFGQSSFAQKAIVRGASAVKIDKDLPLAQMCPLGCGIQTGAGTVLDILKPRVGGSVAVFGAGAVGMAGIMAARLTPAVKIIAVDILDSKLEMARTLGATHTINSTKTDVVSEIRALTGGFEVEGAFDATGLISVIKAMIDCAAPRATVVATGSPRMGEMLEIEPATWITRGISYMGAHQGSSNPNEVGFVSSQQLFGALTDDAEVHSTPHAVLEEWSFSCGQAGQNLSLHRDADGHGRSAQGQVC